MIRNYLLFLFLLPLCLPVARSQTVETIHAPQTIPAKTLINAGKRPAQSLTAPVAIDPAMVAAQKKWNITLSQHGVSHAGDVPKNVIDSIKQAGSLLRRDAGIVPGQAGQQETPSLNGLALTPQVSAGFKGNKYNYWAPPDNHLAVSDDGYIVSVINSSLYFADENGSVLLEENFGDFLAFLNLTGGYFDPRVLYDPSEDKFILVVLNGNTPANSRVVVGFSTSGNPNDTWWFYTFSGDPTGSNLWVDYPSIGISTDDLYISGNQYTANNVSAQALIYQLPKAAGFTGGFIDGIHWYDVKDANGFTDYTIVPISHGFDATIGPGIYFISTDGGGGAEAMLYYTDGNAQSNPNLHVFSVPLPKYYVPFDGIMLGTDDELKTGDCRTVTGFYADGTVHFAFNDRGDDFHTKVHYCRVNTGNLSQNSLLIGQTPFEYAYPSIAPFTTDPADKTVLIGFLRSSGSIYPEFSMAVVDNDLNYSGAFQVKQGESFTASDAGDRQRWGDYTGISRRHSATGPEVWISGCYGDDFDNGASNILCTWIARVTDGQSGSAPAANFGANQTLIAAGQQVSFSDQSANGPTGWSWTFPGGTPGASTLKNPVVTYHTPGTYPVTLAASNAFGSDTETKAAFITVQPVLLPPVAQFTSDVVTVSPNGSVQFEDLSANTPASWQWFFEGALPATSTLQHPVVVYPSSGCFDVTLVATNAAGSHSVTKQCYISSTTDVVEQSGAFHRFLVYPNPVTGDRLNIVFETARAAELHFSVVDGQGRIVKQLLDRRAKAGAGELAFNTEPLAAGVYYLVVLDEHNHLLKNEKFIVGR